MKPVTLFSDGHSGGSRKIAPFQYILIEARRDIAKLIFEKKFGRHPEHVTCHCCGEDYTIYDVKTEKDLATYTGYAPYENVAMLTITRQEVADFIDDESTLNCWD